VVLIGQDYANNSEYEKSLFYLNKALQEFKLKNYDEGITYVLGLKAWVYEAKGDYVAATKNNIEVIKIAEKKNDSSSLRVGYFTLANNNLMLNKYEEAEKIIDSWYPYLQKNNNLTGKLQKR